MPAASCDIRPLFASLPVRLRSVRSRAGPADLSRRASQDGGRRWVREARAAGLDDDPIESLLR